MKPDPKRAIRAGYLAGRRGVRWPMAWARAKVSWDGEKAWAAVSAAWNRGREDAGLYPLPVV